MELRKDSSVAWTSHSHETFLYLRAIQGHSEGTHINPTLQDNVLLPDDVAEHIYHVGSSHDTHSIIQSELIPGGKDVKKETHAVFFTAVNPMFVDQHKEVEYDLTNPRIAVYKNHWKVHQNTVYGCNWRVAQSKGLQFYQTRSNAIILYNTLSEICIKNVVTGSQETHCATKCFSLQDYRKKPYSSPICIMDIRILVILKREHPSTIKAKKAKGPGKPVAIAIAAEELKSSVKNAAAT